MERKDRADQTALANELDVGGEAKGGLSDDAWVWSWSQRKQTCPR